MNHTTNSELEAYKNAFYAKRREKAMAAMEERAKQGLHNCAAPLGYKNAYIEGEKVAVIDETITPLICEVFKLAASGKYSLAEMLQKITDKNLVTKRGKPLGKVGLWKALTNPFYAGLISYNGVVLPGKHTPIVSREIFERTQKALSKRSKR